MTHVGVVWEPEVTTILIFGGLEKAQLFILIFVAFGLQNGLQNGSEIDKKGCPGVL